MLPANQNRNQAEVAFFIWYAIDKVLLSVTNGWVFTQSSTQSGNLLCQAFHLSSAALCLLRVKIELESLTVVQGEDLSKQEKNS